MVEGTMYYRIDPPDPDPEWLVCGRCGYALEKTEWDNSDPCPVCKECGTMTTETMMDESIGA